jgi:hypothetical protein
MLPSSFSRSTFPLWLLPSWAMLPGPAAAVVT